MSARMLRALLVSALLAPGVGAQARADSTGLAGGVGGLSVSYEALLQEYRSFQPLREATVDTSGTPTARQVAEAFAAAATRRPAVLDGVRRLEIDGLIVDETLTRPGREFYALFYRLWAPPAEAVGFTIEIMEQPAQGLTTAIRVQVNDELVYQTRLSPRADDIEEDVQQAVAAAYRRLQRSAGPPTSY